MNQLFLIGIGGAIGSVARYILSTKTYELFGTRFPYGTLFVNVTGSFLIGMIAILLLEKFDHFAAELRSLLIIGFLGGYTTFSSFSFETLNLYQNGEIASALLNITISLILCFIATGLGILLGRSL